MCCKVNCKFKRWVFFARGRLSADIGRIADTIKNTRERLRMFYTTESALFGFLYANLIRPLIKRRTGLSLFQGITYGFGVKECYTYARRGKEFYTETIYI